MPANLTVRQAMVRPNYPSLLLLQRPEPPNLRRRCLFLRNGNFYVVRIYITSSFCLDFTSLGFVVSTTALFIAVQSVLLHISTVISYALFFSHPWRLFLEVSICHLTLSVLC